MKRKDRRSGRPGSRNLCQDLIELVVAVGDHRQYRSDQHGARQAGVGDCPDQPQPRLRCRRTRFQRFMDLLLGERDRDRHAHRNLFGCSGQQWQIAACQRSLGEDRERRAGSGEGGDDPRHQQVSAFCALVRVGVGAECHWHMRPRRAAQLAGEHLPDIDLDHDLTVEVRPRIKIKIGMGAPSEAVRAGVAAASIRIDRPREWHPSRRRHSVQRRFRQHLMESDALELWGVDRPYQVLQPIHPRQSIRVGRRCVRDLLTCPSHADIQTQFRYDRHELLVFGPYAGGSCAPPSCLLRHRVSATSAVALERCQLCAARRGSSDVTDVQLGTGMPAYLRLLRHGPAAGPFAFAAVARLTLAMIPLGILILVEHQRHAYAIGAAVGTPVWGRLMDRYGQVAVLLPTTITSAALLVGLALATVSGAPDKALIAIAAGVGLSYPAISPALRSSFRIVLPDPRARKVAFALDATSVELAFVCGPLLLSALLVPRIPLLPLLVTAALVAGGGVGYCATGVARRASAAVQRAAAGESSRTTGTGQRKALASTSDRALGGSEQVGILFAAIAGGSTVGGLAFGARSWSFEERRAIPVLLCLFGLFLALLAGLLSMGAVSLLILLPVLFLTGLTIAPTLIMQQGLLDHLAPAHRLNEAQAFLSASNTTGAALGTAIAGIVIDVAGLSWSFGGAALAAVFAAGVAVPRQLRRQILQRHS